MKEFRSDEKKLACIRKCVEEIRNDVIADVPPVSSEPYQFLEQGCQRINNDIETSKTLQSIYESCK